jgi:RimJ/RimL family protein N-acetyltransferase
VRKALETPRLRLRDWRAADAEAAFVIDGDAEVVRFLCRAPVPDVDTEGPFLAERIERNQLWAPRGLGSWALVERATGDVVGNVLLKPLPPTSDEIEVGWHLARRVWGRGYASEAARALLRYGFEELALDEILAVVAPANARSAAVARRIGMSWRDRTTRYYDGISLDLFLRRIS